MLAELLNVSLHNIDWIVLAVYMAALLVMGAVLRKRATKDLESYFLGGRKMPGWLNGFSYATTCMNADVAPAYCGMTVITGVFICWWYLSRFGLALMIGGILFAVFWRRLKLTTSPEFYELRFSGAPALTIRTWIAVRSAFIAMVAWTGSGLLGLQKVAEPMLGWNIWTTLAVVLPIILFYVLLSGYMGVVMSDFFQAMIVILKSLLIMVLVWVAFGGAMGLQHDLVAKFGTGVTNWYPPTSHELLGVVGIIAWTLGTAIGYGGDAAPMAGAMEGQRILSCKNAREASKMYIWTQIVLFFMLAVLTLPALGIMVKYPGLTYKPDMPGYINKELAYGLILKEYLPPGLLGLAISAILASIMGTVSSNMNFGAQTFLNDVYKRSIVKKASNKHYMMVGRLVAALIVALAVVVAVKAKNVIDISVFMLGLSSAELTANWGQWWWWRFNGKSRLAASFGGPLIFMINHFLIFKTSKDQWLYLFDFGDNTIYYVMFVSIGLTLALWVIVTLMTKPEPQEKLVEFYKRARPMGWWGPIAVLCNDNEERGVSPILRGLGIALMGAVAVGAGVICFSNLYIAKYAVAGWSAAVMVAVGIAFKISFSKYMAELHAEVEEEKPEPEMAEAAK